jgi:two-component system sensor histidine kinase YesM
VLSLGKLKLRRQLGVLIGIALVMMAGTQVFFYIRFQALTRERTRRYTESLVNQVAEQISAQARNAEHGAATVAYNRHVQEYLTTDNPERKYIILLPFVQDLLAYVQSSNGAIYDIILTGTEGQTISSIRGAYEYHYDMREALIRDYGIGGEEAKTPVHTALLQDIDGEFYYAYILPVFSVNLGSSLFEKIGSCVVVSSTQALEKAAADISVSMNSSFMILDGNNTVVAGNRSEDRGRSFESLQPFTVEEVLREGVLRRGREKTIVQSRLLPDSRWKVLSLVPGGELSEELRPVRNFGLLLGALMALALLGSATALARSITRPVSRLVNFIEQVGKGGGGRLEMPAPNEVGIIAGYINRMLDTIEEDTDKLLQAQRRFHETELLKKQAELSALQNQINPHFLYNTLNCISSIALVRDVGEILTISEAMARIFRYSIKQSDLVRIRDEIGLIKDYMEIMGIRYPRRFTLALYMDEGLMELKTVKMILQPLAENAVYHGLEPKNGPGLLAISGRIVSGKALRISVEDDGIGIGRGELEELRRALNTEAPGPESAPPARRGVGLINIHRRIRLMFGAEYGITLESPENGGTGVHLLLPVLEEGDAQVRVRNIERVPARGYG